MAEPQRMDFELELEDAASMKFAFGKDDTPALREFKAGMKLLRGNSPAMALLHFRKAFEMESQNPYFLSYAGVAVARAERNWQEAETHCTRALQMKRNQAQLYLNLAEVYLKWGKREDAVDVLAEGMHYTNNDVRVARALARLGIRRPPVLPFVRRSNPINRALGKIRHRTHKLLYREG